MRKNVGREPVSVSWRAIALGIGTGAVALIAMTGLAAWVLHRELAGPEWADYLAAGILILSSFLAARTAGASAERWMNGLLTAVGMWLILLLIHWAVFDGAPVGAGATALAIMGGTCAAVLMNRGGKRPGKHRRKYRNR